MADREIEFFFDIGSSYSYLAATQMGAVGERTGVPVRWRPFLLGAVFKATGNDTPIRVPAKARWLLADMALWARHYGIPFKVPTRFPLVTLRTQRALTAVERIAGPAALAPVALALYRAYWGEDQDVTSDAVIAAAARAGGLDEATATAVVAGIEAPETKDALRATTDEAIRRGAFGAPSLFVGDVLFWGNDRLPLLEQYLAKLG